MMAYGLRPFFTDKTIGELMEGQSYFMLHFNETLNAQVKKQMDVLVQFWSETHNEVRMKYLTSVMFGHTRAEDVVKEMLGVLDKLAISLRLMISLGLDRPSMNKSIMHKVKQVK